MENKKQNENEIPFKPFQKIPRIYGQCVVTEKIDGTNACIYIGEDNTFLTGSRTQWITPENDNFGFSAWAHANKEDLLQLGPGLHYGEWWGYKIQRGYNLTERRFSLFNVERWDTPMRPACCDVVPTLAICEFVLLDVERIRADLITHGSYAVLGYMKPEGIVIYHENANMLFKNPFGKYSTTHNVV